MQWSSMENHDDDAIFEHSTRLIKNIYIFNLCGAATRLQQAKVDALRTDNEKYGFLFSLCIL